MINKRMLIAGILLVILIALPEVQSLGITPGRTTVEFERGLEKEVQFEIINNERKDMKVAIMSIVQDDLSGSVTLFDDSIEFLPSEEKKTVKYKLKLPENMSPGLHIGEIIAVELPKTNEQGTSVGATVAVVSQIHIYVPCPGKCIEAELNVLDAEQNETATFIVPVISRGDLGIGNVRAIIDIYRLDEKIATIETNSAPLESKKRTELSGKWFVSAQPGEYTAKVSVFFDEQSSNFEKHFTIGEKMLTIESILVNDFQLGEIAKLQILIENKFNQELKSVFANLQIYNKANDIMADVKSAAEDIPALSKKELIAYWDTVGVKEGTYDGKLMVRYGEKSTEKDLVLKVSQNNLDIVGVGYAIRPQGRTGITLTTILIIVIVLLLVVNLAWFIFFSRFLKNRKEKKSRVIRAE